jgi:hypothetical protein
VIVHFKTADTKDPTYKVNWKDVENAVKAQFPKLKIPYSRADPYEGDLAISSHRLNNEQLEELGKAKITIGGREFEFERTQGEELKSFWTKQGGHYNFCI